MSHGRGSFGWEAGVNAAHAQHWLKNVERRLGRQIEAVTADQAEVVGQHMTIEPFSELSAEGTASSAPN